MHLLHVAALHRLADVHAVCDLVQLHPGGGARLPLKHPRRIHIALRGEGAGGQAAAGRRWQAGRAGGAVGLLLLIVACLAAPAAVVHGGCAVLLGEGWEGTGFERNPAPERRRCRPPHLGDQEVHDQPVHVLFPYPDILELALPLLGGDALLGGLRGARSKKRSTLR